MEFSVLPVQIELEALEDIIFPFGEEVNVLRGALGKALRKVCCDSTCPSAQRCPARGKRTYSRIFEPFWLDGPSGYQNAPRPFVLRVPSLPRKIHAGQTLFAGLHSFDGAGLLPL